MYAVIETGGKQYQVKEGDEIYVEKLESESGIVNFKNVVMIGGDSMTVGTPYVDGAHVTGTILKTDKAKKITVFTYKSKKGKKRKLGHRQPYSKVKIDVINA
jgi:large subunit ribosomal protein L21